MHKSKLWIKALALIVALLVAINISILEIELGNIYYGAMIIVLGLLLISVQRPKINGLLVLFIFVAVISILVNDIPYFFRPYERLLAFIFMVGLIGPLLYNSRLMRFRKSLFDRLNWMLLAMVIISFVGLISNSSFAYEGRGGFTGLFSHSMLTSPFAAIVCLVFMDKGIIEKRFNYSIFYFIFSVISLIICVVAGSRAALIALLIAILFYLYNIFNRSILKTSMAIFVLIIIGVFSFPAWNAYTERIEEKLEFSEKKGSLTITRQQLWIRRLNEIKSSPIFGIGFSNDSSQSIFDFRKGEGQIEPGSSWLVVFSMLGVIGFISFVVLILKNFSNKLYHEVEDLSLSIYKSILVFFIFHMFAEGYVLSAGSGLFFYFWLLLGVMSSNEVKYNFGKCKQ